MTWNELTDPVFLTNVFTSILTLVFVVVSMKQRVHIIIDKIKANKQQEELDEKDVIIEEQNYEIEAIASSVAAMVDILNRIAQVSKLTHNDKAKISEIAVTNKQLIQKIASEKQQRIDAIIEKSKNTAENVGELAETMLNIGNTVIDQYVKKTSE